MDAEIADTILDYASVRGALYADVRLITTRDESMEVKDDVVEGAGGGENSGAGVRVLLNGAWGHGSFPDLTRKGVNLERAWREAVDDAIDAARASALGRTFPIELAPLTDVPDTAEYATPWASDPFVVPLAEKRDFLLAVCRALRGGSDLAVVRGAGFSATMKQQLLVSSEAGKRRYLSQSLGYFGVNMNVRMSDGDNPSQQRSFMRLGSAQGWEYLDELGPEAVAAQIAKEAIELLTAPECESGVMDVIVTPPLLGLHIHETGHGFEGDRILGYEKTYVGGTFIEEIFSDIGSYRFGSSKVNIVADATHPGGYGTFGFDDEGVPAQRFYLVENGVLKNLLTSRETVPQLNARLGRDYFDSSNGTMRASSYARTPLIRMTNISLEPGKETLDDLIGGVKNGLLLDGIASWSMSEDRKNFDFGVEYAREIKNGRLGGVVRHAGYTGDNLAFWSSCDGVAGQEWADMLNTDNCGKGLPGQIMSTGHEASPALFRNVEVYNRTQGGS